MRVGVDTGGTFTDLVAADGRVVKVPSTPDDPAAAVRAAIGGISDTQPRPEVLAHGTTVATNALLERRGARVALVATQGFADEIEIARQARPSLYDPEVDRPAPLVERDLPEPGPGEVRVRVEASKKRLMTVLPRSVGTFLICRWLMSRKVSAVSRMRLISLSRASLARSYVSIPSSLVWSRPSASSCRTLRSSCIRISSSASRAFLRNALRIAVRLRRAGLIWGVGDPVNAESGGTEDEVIAATRKGKQILNVAAVGYNLFGAESLEFPRAAAAELQAMTSINEEAFAENMAAAALLAELGDEAGAAAALDRAVWINPFDRDAHTRLAELASRRGNHRVAVRERIALLALDPTDRVEALYQLAEAYAAAGDVASARREVLRALEQAPNYAKAQDLLLRLRSTRPPSSPP